MAKQSKSPTQPKAVKGNDEGGKFVDRNILGMSVKAAEQFAPTPAEPVRQSYKMAGGC
jgi:hypothetical protein